MDDRNRIDQLVARQRRSFLDELPVSLDARIDRLERATAMVFAYRQRFMDAVASDWPGRAPQMNFLSEVMLPAQALKNARKNVARWMKPERRRSLAPFNLLGARAEIHYQPLGVIGILAPWNAPLNLLLVPLASVLAAGNRAILKASEALPATNAILTEALADYFDDAEVAQVKGGPECAAALCAADLDHLMFTGGTNIGRKVMAAAAEHLTPVTLELGGKCPVIITSDADIEDAAKRIAFGKLSNGGQACLAPDSLYLPAELYPRFVAVYTAAVNGFFPNGFHDDAYSSLINQAQFDKTLAIVEDARSKGAEITSFGDADADTLRIPPILLLDPPDNALATQAELFAPLMAVHRYQSLDEVFEKLKAHDKPLGLYVFCRDAKTTEQILQNTFSGGATVNDVLFHFFQSDLPFGGVGASGIGAYSQGIHGFRAFSHARAIYRQAGPLALVRPNMPPYGRLYEWLVRAPLEREAAKWEARVLKRKR